MKCILCVPFNWLCARLALGCDKVTRLGYSWDFQQVDDQAILDRDPHKEGVLAGVDLLKSDAEAAFRQLLQFANEGSVWAMSYVGHAYELGNGVEANLIEAEEWYRRAYESGSQYSQLCYGGILARRKDYPACIEVFSASAAADWAPAQYWLAVYRLKLSRTRQTLDEVRRLLERASAQGSISADLFLGRLLLRGEYGFSSRFRGFRAAMRAEAKTRPEGKATQEKSGTAPVTGELMSHLGSGIVALADAASSTPSATAVILPS